MRRKVLVLLMLATTMIFTACGHEADKPVTQAEKESAVPSQTQKKTSDESAEMIQESSEEVSQEDVISEKSDAAKEEEHEDVPLNPSQKMTDENIDQAEISDETDSDNNISPEQKEFGVTAQWEEDLQDDLEDVKEISVSDSDYTARVVFTANETIKNVRIFLLTYQNSDGEGQTAYEMEEMYSVNEMAAGEKLIVRMDCFGSVPDNGISFVDEKGVKKSYLVNVRDEDGALFLTEF